MQILDHYCPSQVYSLAVLKDLASLIPFYLAAMEKKFLHGCEIKSGRRPGKEARIWLHESIAIVGQTKCIDKSHSHQGMLV